MTDNRGAPGAVSTPVVGIVGLGSVLMGDDAFGPYCIKSLEASYDLPEGVSALDAGTPGFDLTPHISGLKVLIVVDTVRSDGPPGEVKLYRKEEILRHLPQARVNPHDPGLKEALLTLDFSGGGPEEVLLIGAVPKSLAAGTGMTTELKAAVPRAIEAVLAELNRLDMAATLKDEMAAPDIWWERVVDAGPS